MDMRTRVNHESLHRLQWLVRWRTECATHNRAKKLRRSMVLAMNRRSLTRDQLLRAR
jgi:hypothetical protein